MFLSAFRAARRAPALTPPRALAMAAAIAAGYAFAAPALAQSPVIAGADAAVSMPAIVVTGARFDSDPALTPIGATIITADEIRRAGAGDVNAAIRKIGGVYGRQSLDGSPDFSLDLRGFGTNSSQNMVVVLDGVRLSENELANATLSTIPIDTVDHIEITRGGSSVLYGDGATGGIINIVTKRPDKQSGRGTVYVEAGQLGQREARASAAQTWSNLAVDATVDALHTDNYRDNNAFKQYNFSGGAQWFSAAGRAGVRVEAARQDQRLAGSLKTEAQYDADPRQTLTPDDFGSLNTGRITGFVERHIGDFDFAAELSHREKTARATYFDDGVASPSQYNSKQTQFSPRLRYTSDIGGLLNEAVAGIDLQRWERETVYQYSMGDATQHSKALYVRDEIRFDPSHDGRVSAGVRREIFDKNSYDPVPYAADVYAINQALNAWDLQASYAPVQKLEVYAKAGQSYRLPNADENGYTPQANVPLLPQVSHDLELGASYGDAARKLTARVFRHQLHNEIFYDPTAGSFGANTNLDPTKRQGFELDGQLRVAADWNVTGHYQHVQATSTEGPNDGRELVLVPKNVLTTRVTWTPADGQTADFGAQWVDRQRYGDDFDNSCSGQMPSFTTFDGRYARKFGQWELALIGLNLADKQYFSQAFTCKGAIYPSNGRQMKVSARYDF